MQFLHGRTGCMRKVIVFFNLIASSLFYGAIASDPHPLQDFCVADMASEVGVNGFSCKSGMEVSENDFLLRGLHIPRNADNRFGFNTTTVGVDLIPGLNTLGISMSRVDLAPYGVNPPHFHPRGSELLIVLQGSAIQVGFVSSSPENKLFSKVLKKGDVFMFPPGLVHFQRNMKNQDAVVITFFSSQNAGGVPLGGSLFGSTPLINVDVVAKAFQIDKEVVTKIQSKKF